MGNPKKRCTYTSTMKLFLLSLASTLLTSALAAPAVVWTKSSTSSDSAVSTTHSSDPTSLTSLLAPYTSQPGSHLVLVLGRTDEGNDALTTLASSDQLPKVSQAYGKADTVHHYVKGNESPHVLSKQLEDMHDLFIETDMSKFSLKEIEEEGEGVTLVHVPWSSPASAIDALVAQALTMEALSSVTLTSIRPLTEVLLERDLAQKAQYAQFAKEANTASTHRRRLEDANDDESSYPIYYVSVTPNILSGILFFGFFIAIALVGLTCMASIGFSDVYVANYPAIGKEV